MCACVWVWGRCACVGVGFGLALVRARVPVGGIRCVFPCVWVCVLSDVSLTCLHLHVRGRMFPMLPLLLMPRCRLEVPIHWLLLRGVLIWGGGFLRDEGSWGGPEGPWGGPEGRRVLRGPGVVLG